MAGIIWEQLSICLFQSSFYKGYQWKEVVRICSLDHVYSMDCWLQACWETEGQIYCPDFHVIACFKRQTEVCDINVVC